MDSTRVIPAKLGQLRAFNGNSLPQKSGILYHKFTDPDCRGGGCFKSSGLSGHQ